jgi:hypothetical protein
MTPRDCFGVVLRSIGLAALVASVLYLYSGIVVLFSSDSTGSSPAAYFISTVVTFVIGRYLLKGAPRVVSFAYGATGVEHPNHNAVCNFCGKSHTEVKKLIQGPGVYICDACVGVCKGAIEKEIAKEQPGTTGSTEAPK